jgi:hypothetical protein
MLHFALKSQSILVAAVSAAGLLVACSSDQRDFGNATAGAAGAAAKGGSSSATAGAAGSGTAIAGNTSTGSGGTAAGGSPGVAAGGTGGSATPGAGSGGTVTGTAGAPAGGSPGAAGAGVAGGTTGGVACPTNATFCSGFEDTTLPPGAVYKANAAPGDWTRDFAIDTSLFRGGKSSLRVKLTSEAGASTSAYRMLAVPAPTGAFWVRFYIQQTDIDLGGNHNMFAGAAASDDPNGSGTIEFAEDVGIAFNTSDAVRWPTGYGRLTSGGTKPFTLPKGMWHCIEISFDSQAREQQLFINGVQQIDAKDYPAAATTIKIFKFGFMQFHGDDRKVWYDDVAVAPTRIKCL